MVERMVPQRVRLEEAINGLYSENPVAKFTAIENLQSLHRNGADIHEAYPILNDLLRFEDNINIRMAVYNLYEQVGGYEAIQAFIGGLQEENPQLRLHSVEALSKLYRQGADISDSYALMRDLLRYDGNTNIRRAVYALYEQVGGHDAVEAFTSGLLEDNPQLRLMSIEALDRLYQQGADITGAYVLLRDMLRYEDNVNMKRAIYAIYEQAGGQEALQIFIEGLQEENPQLRLHAIEVLGRMKQQGADIQDAYVLLRDITRYENDSRIVDAANKLLQ